MFHQIPTLQAQGAVQNRRRRVEEPAVMEDSLERPFSKFLDGNEILSFALFKGRVWASWGQEAISTQFFYWQPSLIVKVFLCRGAHVLSQRATEGLIVPAHLHEHLSTADVSICCGATAGCLACQCGYCSRWQLLLYHQVDGLGGEACWQGRCFWNFLAMTQWTCVSWCCLLIELGLSV